MKKTKKKLKTKSKMLIVIGIALIIITVVLIICFKVKSYTNDRPYYFNVTDDITIKYAYSYSVPTAEIKNKQNDFMDILSFKLEGKDLKDMQKLLKSYAFHLDKSRDPVGVGGEYVLLVGEEKVIIDQELALYTKNNKDFYLIDVKTELYDLVSDITWKVLEKNFTELKASEISINGRERNTTFNDKERVNTLCSLFRYKELKSYDEEIGDAVYTLDFHNGIVISVYEGSIGKINKNGQEKYIIFYTDPREDIRNLFDAKIEEDDDLIYKSTYSE